MQVARSSFDADSLASLLARTRDTHDRMFALVAVHFEAATADRADFWDRWAAVRFLHDTGGASLKMEQETLRRLAGRVAPTLRPELERAAADLAAAGAEVDRHGRRQVPSDAFTRATRRYLAALRDWQGLVERAVAGAAREAAAAS